MSRDVLKLGWRRALLLLSVIALGIAVALLLPTTSLLGIQSSAGLIGPAVGGLGIALVIVGAGIAVGNVVLWFLSHAQAVAIHKDRITLRGGLLSLSVGVVLATWYVVSWLYA